MILLRDTAQHIRDHARDFCHIGAKNVTSAPQFQSSHGDPGLPCGPAFLSWQWHGDSCKVKQWKIGTPFSDGLRPRKLGNLLVHIIFDTFIIPFDFQASMSRDVQIQVFFARSPYVSFLVQSQGPPSCPNYLELHILTFYMGVS